VKDTYYLTSAIYYVNDVPHVGHTYEIVACDVIARYRRARGERVFFLTGSDEHSQNVAKAAEERGLTPQAWTDEIVPQWQEVWRRLGISYDDWIRTSEPRHVERVQRFVQTLHDAGDVYLGTYEGPYCVSCEEFKQETELLDGDRCPVHGIPVQRLAEDNYFFRLSKYEDDLLRLYDEHPEFIQPGIRRNEVLSFVRGGLKDLSISRPAKVWGVPLPWDANHVVYVWVDALLNYITAVGYGADGPDAELFDRVWPADVHMIGKDITRFHAVIWPAMLMSAGQPVPVQVFAHGWLSFGGQKMSKTLGTGIPPADVLERFGQDAYRWYFLREVQFGQDGDFTWDSIAARYTSELANGLGNLASRVLAMTDSYFQGEVPEPSSRETGDGLAAAGKDLAERFDAHMTALELTEGFAAVAEFVREANRYLVEVAPWNLAKDSARRQDLADCLYRSLEALRIVALLVAAAMPEAAERLWVQLGIVEALEDHRLPQSGVWGGLEPGTKTARGEALFPRLEEPKA
jgi:methionyl-tRNA synthetase